MMLTRREVGALGTLAAILIITGIWWALALWPLPTEAPDWLVRTRAVCFGSVHNGLPTTAGWMALIGQPVYMLASLWLISGHSVSRGLRSLSRLPAGRSLLAGSAALAVLGLTASGIRVARAAGSDPGAPVSAENVADAPRVNRAAPALALIDQHGARRTLKQFRGRPIFVAFAFAHCETVCPLIVRDVLRAQAQSADLEPVVIVVTLDPWRDTPVRLPAIAGQWQLGKDAYVLSGSVADVEQTLDAWQVGRARDQRTGEVTHASLVYVLDRGGRIAFILSGAPGAMTLSRLAQRL